MRERNAPEPMVILNTFLSLLSYLITLDCFVVLGMFAVFVGLIALFLKIVGVRR